MTTTHIYPRLHTSRRPALSMSRLFARIQINWRPRKSTLICAALFFLGISIPALMALDILPLNFLLGFLGFALTSAGGVAWLICCGEIS